MVGYLKYTLHNSTIQADFTTQLTDYYNGRKKLKAKKLLFCFYCS